jgi:drug/metabolite transporter (DMT)-like permease
MNREPLTESRTGTATGIRKVRASLYPALAALLAAALFGAGVPLAKLLAGQIEAIPLAALLYLGSGVGLLLFQGAQRLTGRTGRESAVARTDLPWLVGATLAGGVLAPVILMFALRSTPAATASLLLNFEGVATALLAALLFREHLGGRTWLAVLLVTIAGSVLSWNPVERLGLSLGVLGVVAACALWGLDNNLSRHISGKNPVTIAAAKGMVGGTCSLVMAMLLRNPLPPLPACLLAMTLGLFSYGVSIVLFIYALRGLGAARTGALFATAPFIGTALSLAMFRDRPNLQFLMAIPLMLIGAVLLLAERHAHRHAHVPLEHDHRHRHDDDHHRHEHRPEPAAAEHAHQHVHEPANHEHPHTPDEHHRHEHPRET